MQYVLESGLFNHCSFSVLRMLKCWFQKTKDELREISTAKKLFDCVSNVKALHKSFYPHELQVLLASAFQVWRTVLLHAIRQIFHILLDARPTSLVLT
jgi:hypothetical protein